jgi:hypothetical protein
VQGGELLASQIDLCFDHVSFYMDM